MYNIKYSTNYKGVQLVKNQRLLTIILILTLAISLCLLAGCGCDHTTTAWYKTDTTHKLVCADCGVGLAESQNHEWETDGINCTTCDIGEGYTTGLEYELSSNEAYFTLVGPGSFWDTKLNIAPLYFGIPVQKVGPSAFCNEDKLEKGVDTINEVIEEVTIPSSITYIGEMAFDWIDNLTKVTFAPDSQLETIGRLAFAYNYNLTEITIPASVTDVKENAFVACQALTIKYEGSNISSWHKNSLLPPTLWFREQPQRVRFSLP